jgi:hypothetical protein
MTDEMVAEGPLLILSAVSAEQFYVKDMAEYFRPYLIKISKESSISFA